MAAQRIAPPPFSESGRSRLQELKSAKRRAEGRRAGGTGGDDHSCAGSVSSSGSTAVSMPEEEVDGEVRRHAWTLGSSLVVLTTLLFLRRHPLLLDLHLVARNSLDVLLVALQACALRALLNAVLLYSFDGFDFGQKRLVAHMDYGRRLFAQKVETLSRVATVAAATASCGCAALEGSLPKLLCSLAEDGAFSAMLRRAGARLPRFDPRELSFPSFPSVDAGNSLGRVLARSAGVGTSIFRHVGAAAIWIAAQLSAAAPGASRTLATFPSAALENVLQQLSSACRGACDSDARPRQRWGARALDISSFLTLRLGVFVVALLLMGCALLPKPEKKKHRRRDKPLNRSRQASNVGGSISVMKAITEEDL